MMLRTRLNIGLVSLGTILILGWASSGTVKCQPSGAAGADKSAPSVSLNGVWTLRTDGTTGTLYTNEETFYVTQTGNEVDGRSPSGEKLTGFIKGNTIEMRRGAGIGWLIYTGTIEGEALKGEFTSVDGEYSGYWTARRIKK